jgi:hypothetical protein
MRLIISLKNNYRLEHIFIRKKKKKKTQEKEAELGGYESRISP